MQFNLSTFLLLLEYFFLLEKSLFKPRVWYTVFCFLLGILLFYFSHYSSCSSISYWNEHYFPHSIALAYLWKSKWCISVSRILGSLFCNNGSFTFNLVPIPQCFNYYSYTRNLNILECIPFKFTLFLKNFFTTLGLSDIIHTFVHYQNSI